MSRLASLAFGLTVAVVTVAFAGALAPCVAAQDRADHDAIVELLHRYAALEDSADMTAQARLMTPDRVWVTGAGRVLDQARNMEIQQHFLDLRRGLFPGHRTYTTVRYPHIHFPTEDVAVASYQWETIFVPTAQEMAEFGDDLPTFLPSWRTVVVVREGGQWRIAHTHVTPAN